MNDESICSIIPGLISVVGLCVDTVDVASDVADEVVDEQAGETKSVRVTPVGESIRVARAVLSTKAQTTIIDAQLIIGSQRQLAAVAHAMSTALEQTATIELPKLNELTSLLDEHSDKRVVLLASGDPLFYGIGRWLGQHMAQERLRYFPALSSVQVACSRIGLSWQDVRVISLHGRPVESLRTQLHDKATLMVLTDQHSHPVRLAQECIDAGLGLSTLTVFEKLGYPEERVQQFAAGELADPIVLEANIDSPEPSNRRLQFDALNVVLIQVAVAACGTARYLPVFPGIPDQHFSTGAAPGKGMITKREARLAILSYLSPGIDDIIWDIGAGCGGVAVELAYWNSKTTVYAIEHHKDRLTHLHENRRRFGVVSNMNILEGRAPACLDELPMPNKVFIGGSDGELESLLKLVWPTLTDGGLLVASAVTQSTRSTLATFAGTLSADQVESVELSVKRGALLDDAFQYTPKLPVEIFCLRKSTELIAKQRQVTRQT